MTSSACSTPSSRGAPPEVPSSRSFRQASEVGRGIVVVLHHHQKIQLGLATVLQMRLGMTFPARWSSRKMEEEVERDTVYGLSPENRPSSLRFAHRELTRRKVV